MAVERRRRRYPVTSPISLLASKLPFLSPRERTRDSAIPSRSRLTPSETSAYAPQQRSSTGGYLCSFRTVGPAPSSNSKSGPRDNIPTMTIPTLLLVALSSTFKSACWGRAHFLKRVGKFTGRGGG